MIKVPLEHRKKVSEKVNQLIDKVAEKVGQKPLLFCPYCAKVYVNVERFAIHLRSKHNCTEEEIENIVQRYMKKFPELQRKKLRKGKTYWFEKTKKLDDFFG